MAGHVDKADASVVSEICVRETDVDRDASRALFGQAAFTRRVLP